MSTKLVRDRIRDVEGYIPCSSDVFRPVRNIAEYKALLLKKIHEELGELLEAHEIGDILQRVKEGADLIEVLFKYIEVETGASVNQVMDVIIARNDKAGGFGGLVWEHP